MSNELEPIRRKRGRPVGSYSKQRWIPGKLSAAQILESNGERRLWNRLLESEDDRVVLDAVKFLTIMRDGKPVQQINVTSTSINVSAEDIARARAIARTLGGSSVEGLSLQRTFEAEENVSKCLLTGETMLREDDGGKKDGDV